MSHLQGAERLVAKSVLHGINGGVSSELSGGKFGAGFLSGAFSEAAAESGLAGKLGGGTKTGELIATAVIGGTAAELGGGRFANGAVTAAFVLAHNAWRHDGGGEPEHALCIEECSVIVNSVNAGARYVSGEFGTIYVVDSVFGIVDEYAYGAFGVGPSGPTIVTGAASFEVGAVRGPISPDQFAGPGYAVSGFVAAGRKGWSGQYFSSFANDAYKGAATGYAAGAGIGAGLMATHTLYNRSYPIDLAPSRVRNFGRQGN